MWKKFALNYVYDAENVDLNLLIHTSIYLR